MGPTIAYALAIVLSVVGAALYLSSAWRSRMERVTARELRSARPRANGDGPRPQRGQSPVAAERSVAEVIDWHVDFSRADLDPALLVAWHASDDRWSYETRRGITDRYIAGLVGPRRDVWDGEKWVVTDARAS